MIDARLYYASAVLADGRVVALAVNTTAGQSASTGIGCSRIYNRLANTWQSASTPGWAAIGDAPLRPARWPGPAGLDR